MFVALLLLYNAGLIFGTLPNFFRGGQKNRNFG